MYHLIRTLFVEQNTADEIVVFLLLGTLLTFLAAFTAYALVLVFLWRFRMHKTHSLYALFFPSFSQFRKYLAEYSIAFATALLLATTLITKHTVVDDILNQDISEIGRDAVLAALPSGTLSSQDVINAGADSVTAKNLVDFLEGRTAEAIGIRAEDFIKPLLSSGLNTSAGLISLAAVNSAGFSGKRMETILLVIATLMLFGYAGWFSWRRCRGVEAKGDNDPEYSEVAKRLSVPAFCIPLLIISATSLTDSDRLARSAAAVSLSDTGSNSAWLEEIVSQQADRVRRFDRFTRADSSASQRMDRLTYEMLAITDSMRLAYAGMQQFSNRLSSLDVRFQRDSSGTSRSLAELRMAIADLRTQLARIDALESRLTGIMNGMQGFDERIGAAQRASESANRGVMETQRRVERLEGRMAQLGEQGPRQAYLLVASDVSGVYDIQSNGRVVQRGSGHALFALRPGTYTVAGAGFEPVVISLKEGDAGTATMRQVVGINRGVVRPPNVNRIE